MRLESMSETFSETTSFAATFCSTQCIQHGAPPPLSAHVALDNRRRPRPTPPGPCDLFNDFYDATSARLHDHRPVVHDRIPVARPHMILAGYRVERHTSLWEHRAD